VTVAAWPTLILVISDSLNATVIVSEPVFTISANAELDELDELEPPRLPALVLLGDEPVEDDDEDDDEPFVVDPADTESPGCRLESDTIVPLVGANSRVLASVCLAV
jgi:hypothetical protein